MNRTVELILGITGAVIDALFTLVGVLILVFATTGLDLIRFPEMESINNILFVFVQFFWIPIISCIISCLLGLFGVLNIKRKPRRAGGFFIAAAVISSWLLFTGFAYQSVLYFIAGIMCFSRKEENM